MQKLRWGILGVAKINDRIIPAFQNAHLSELRAIASRAIDKAKSAASAAGIPTAHGSYEALLADPNVDAVYIPLPNTLHDEWTRRAADAGKHILCEKPLTPNADEATKLIAHCRSRGVQLMDGFMWPHHPRTAKLRSFLDQGGIGKVQRVTSAFTFPLPFETSNIRLKSDMAGGSLLDVGCYPVYGIRWAFGAEPVRVYATARYLHDVDLEMSAILWFADGRVASFDCGFASPYRAWMEIVGSEGSIFVPLMWLPGPKAEYIVRRGENVVEEMVPGHDQIAHMLDDFSRAVLNKQAMTPSPDEAIKSLRVMDALARSAREGKPIDL